MTSIAPQESVFESKSWEFKRLQQKGAQDLAALEPERFMHNKRISMIPRQKSSRIQLFRGRGNINFLHLWGNPNVIDHQQNSSVEKAWKRFWTSSRIVELAAFAKPNLHDILLGWRDPERFKNKKTSTTCQESSNNTTILRGKNQLSATLQPKDHSSPPE